MSITDVASTGIAKGESYADVAEMLNNYGDMVVLRDAEKSSVYEMKNALQIPIINGGNGMDEHPTQALADVYALLKWNPDCFVSENSGTAIRLGVIGVPDKMRTVRSLLLLLANFKSSFEEIVVITDDDAPFSDEQRAELDKHGLNISVTSEFKKTLPTLDVIYQNAILWKGEEFESLGNRFRLDGSSPLKPSAILLHPLARGSELSTELDNTPHNWYFAQARGAVFIRMALLSAILKIFI
jgi:aspartate carbamoyltransferase catalytic subunit